MAAKKKPQDSNKAEPKAEPTTQPEGEENNEATTEEAPKPKKKKRRRAPKPSLRIGIVEDGPAFNHDDAVIAVLEALPDGTLDEDQEKAVAGAIRAVLMARDPNRLAIVPLDGTPYLPTTKEAEAWLQSGDDSLEEGCRYVVIADPDVFEVKRITRTVATSTDNPWGPLAAPPAEDGDDEDGDDDGDEE